MLPLYKRVDPFNGCSKFLKKHHELLLINLNHRFFFNTPTHIQVHLLCILWFCKRSLPTKYLDALLALNALKSSTWKDILSKLRKNLNSWTLKSLNLVGCLILILNFFLQDMLLYLLSSLSTPKSMIKNICNLQ